MCAHSRAHGAFRVRHATIVQGWDHHGFTTQNTLKRPERMELSLIEGPFETFSGHWVFRPLGAGACKVSLRLQFELAAASPAWRSGNYSIKLHSIWWTLSSGVQASNWIRPDE